MRRMVVKLASWGHVGVRGGKEHMNGKEMVLDAEHNLGRWAIIEAKRMEDINESNQSVSNVVEMFSKFAN